ncbi:hypothetical protein CV019_00020 [Staphylococcus haemolyticus]|uniref:Uncharacterized protein n=1 Tax=Staphylococcus haemolyticus TaxID=1283 RepID=A0A7Z1SEW3_STAHA|nr:hypothetical protein CV019_00020 [Staphylococcus haemolyticus]
MKAAPMEQEVLPRSIPVCDDVADRPGCQRALGVGHLRLADAGAAQLIARGRPVRVPNGCTDAEAFERLHATDPPIRSLMAVNAGLHAGNLQALAIREEADAGEVVRR